MNCHSDRSRSECDGEVEEPAFSLRQGADVGPAAAAQPGGRDQTNQTGEFMKRKQEKKKSEMFDGLKQSLSQALAYERGEKVSVRVSQLPPPPKPLTAKQIRAIRQSFHVSQAVFARLINVSLNAVESWEQGVRRPREATLKLLTIAHKHPEVLLSAE